MKILIADDHHLIIEGLEKVLHKAFPNYQIFCATNLEDLRSTLLNEDIDVLIQDIKFGQFNANDFINELKNDYPKLKIIIVSSISDHTTIQKFYRKTDGYIIKSEHTNELIKAIKTVVSGEKFLSCRTKNLIDNLNIDCEIVLSRREKEIITVIMKEKSINEIAEELCISPKTVEMHRSNLFAKLGVNNITGLVKTVIAKGLVES